jgi:hypothetical protein
MRLAHGLFSYRGRRDGLSRSGGDEAIDLFRQLVCRRAENGSNKQGTFPRNPEVSQNTLQSFQPTTCLYLQRTIDSIRINIETSIRIILGGKMIAAGSAGASVPLFLLQDDMATIELNRSR